VPGAPWLAVREKDHGEMTAGRRSESGFWGGRRGDKTRGHQGLGQAVTEKVCKGGGPAREQRKERS